MGGSRVKFSQIGSVLACILAMFAPTASACSVCFGDPESDLAKGAIAGVILLGSVIGSVLLGVAGFICFWTVRARRLNQAESSSDRS